MPAPIDPGANLFDILSSRIRQTAYHILAMDLDDLQRLFYLALTIYAVSLAMLYLSRKLRAKL